MYALQREAGPDQGHIRMVEHGFGALLRPALDLSLLYQKVSANLS